MQIIGLFYRTLEGDGMFPEYGRKNVAMMHVHGQKTGYVQRGNCNYCHKPGHWVKDCRKKKRNDQKRFSQTPQQFIQPLVQQPFWQQEPQQNYQQNMPQLQQQTGPPAGAAVSRFSQN